MEAKADNASLNIREFWMSASEPRGDAPEVAALLQRAVAGDSAAFAQIVCRYERRVLTLAWRLLGSLEDAEDAAQETFLRAFKYLHRYDTAKPIGAWLVGITVNVCRDVGRNRQRRSAITEDSFMTVVPADPYSELALEQQRQLLRIALASLPEKERAAVVLRDLDGLSTAEVAEALGSSQATVRSQISSARVKIRKAIARMTPKKGVGP
jgi:RNA polymerase sigma-70 factor (ECF subfamily)